MKRLLLKFVIATVVIPGLVAYSIFYLNKRGFFNIQKIEIVVQDEKIHERFFHPRIENLKIILATYQNKSLWDLRLREVAKLVESQEWVESVNVVRLWPANLEVRVGKKKIEFLLSNKVGKLYPVTDQAELLGEVEVKHAPDVILLQGDAFKSSSELRRKALSLVKEIPNEGGFSKVNISEISYDKKEGFWARIASDGLRVKLGQDNYSLKAARVNQVLEYMSRNEKSAAMIDADFSKKVLVKVK